MLLDFLNCSTQNTTLSNHTYFMYRISFSLEKYKVGNSFINMVCSQFGHIGVDVEGSFQFMKFGKLDGLFLLQHSVYQLVFYTQCVLHIVYINLFFIHSVY